MSFRILLLSIVVGMGCWVSGCEKATSEKSQAVTKSTVDPQDEADAALKKAMTVDPTGSPGH